MASEDCAICCEPIKGAHVKKLECPKCLFSCCTRCVKMYIDTLSGPVACMNEQCTNVWGRALLAQYMTKDFMRKDYLEYRRKAVWEHEASLIPEVVPLVSARTAADNVKVKMDEIKNQLSKRVKETEKLVRELYNELDKTRKVFNTRIQHCKTYIEAEREFADDPDNNTRPDPFVDPEIMSEEQIQEAQQIIEDRHNERVSGRGHCPKDDCNGLIGEGWKCVVCSTHVCRSCLEERTEGDTHTCDDNILESVRQIRKDSKRCPHCKVLVHRIFGCDQMWCTNCKTRFSYSTLKLTRGSHFHNPHYYEFMRSQTGTVVAREDDDVDMACAGGQLLIENLVKTLNERKVRKRHIDAIVERARIANEINDAQPANRHAKNARELRVKVFRGEITKDEFKQKIEQLYKKRDKEGEIEQIFQAYTAVVFDTLRGYIADPNMTSTRVLLNISKAYTMATRARKSLRQNYQASYRIYFQN